jgi:DNA-directed RNA polymerase specialized sigma24 family protein
MTYDNLKNVRRQRLRVKSLNERIDRLRARAESTTRQLGERGSEDATRDRLAEYVAELDALEQELTGEVIALEHEIKTVDDGLNALPQIQETVLRLRYCEGLKWRLVSSESGIEERQCYRIHNAYLKTVIECQ